MIRLILILLIIILIARGFIIYAADNREDPGKSDIHKKKDINKKGVPKGIGEYIDYEEVKK